jgi:protein-S-isoprenylcysteine O-methyltransferase Ste14
MVRRMLVRTIVWLALTAALLFGSAGTMAWPQAWIFLVEIAAVSLTAGPWFARHDPGLLEQRMASPIQRGQPLWDKALLVSFLLLYLCSFIVMGLDAVRWRLTSLPMWAQVVGAAAILASYGAIWRVLAENTFAAPVVRIQEERGHRLITSGPYAIVRHPMYGATLPFIFGTPLLLGSVYGLAIALAMTLLLAVRAVLEERVLEAHFPEYRAYKEKVRYRFAPLVW